MKSTAIIILGRNVGDNRLNFLIDLGGFEKVFDVPFIDAELDSVWKSWKVQQVSKGLGIGKGAAGCYLAHLAAWKICNDHEYSAALILEDDAELTNYGHRQIHKVIEDFHDRDFDLLHLGNDYKVNTKNPIKIILNYGFRYLAKDAYERLILRFRSPRYSKNDFPFSTHSYLISKRMASALVLSEPNFLSPVDVLLNGISTVKNNNVYRTRNILFVQERFDGPSRVTILGR
jgi:GR25 family glycosyltransferase involved in LPS biosynthesis